MMSQSKGHNVYAYERIYTRAKIINITKKSVTIRENLSIIKTYIKMKILDGELKGQIKTAIFGGENNLPKGMDYQMGQTYFIGIAKEATGLDVADISIYDTDNTPSIIILVLLMIFAIILIGKWKGIASLIALTVTILMYFFILIPLTLKGYSPLPIAVGLSILSIFITLPIIAGFKLKTLAAVIGGSIGIICAALLSIIAGYMLHLSGIVTNEMLTIFFISKSNIDLKGLVLSGMIIAALGAIMDICISIASSTAEIYHANPHLSEKEAFKSVLTIGTDILGSMVNTLVLAYVGSSLSMILHISIKLQPGMPFWMVLNYNPVLNEIVKSVIGSIGMFICIPLTAIIAVKLYKRKVYSQA